MDSPMKQEDVRDDQKRRRNEAALEQPHVGDGERVQVEVTIPPQSWSGVLPFGGLARLVG
jgi:hypothetical protein